MRLRFERLAFRVTFVPSNSLCCHGGKEQENYVLVDMRRRTRKHNRVTSTPPEEKVNRTYDERAIVDPLSSIFGRDKDRWCLCGPSSLCEAPASPSWDSPDQIPFNHVPLKRDRTLVDRMLGHFSVPDMPKMVFSPAHVDPAFKNIRRTGTKRWMRISMSACCVFTKESLL